MASDQTAPGQPPVSFSGLADEFGRPTFEDEPEKQPGYNAADPKHIENARKEAGQHRREDADFWRIAMSTPQRRAAFWRLLESCHLFTNPADLGTQYRMSDPYLTYLNLGRQNVGKQMMVAAQDASLDLYMQMVKEHKEREDARERRNGK